MYREKKMSAWRKSKRLKMGNSPTVYDGVRYQSKFEAQVAQDLDLRLKAKDIASWERQVKISLDVNGYHITNYYIDFVVTHNDGSLEYIEVKGYATEVWRLKWKLFEAQYSDRDNIVLTIIKRQI